MNYISHGKSTNKYKDNIPITRVTFEGYRNYVEFKSTL